MRKIIFISLFLITSITSSFGQYSLTWTQEVETTANSFKLLSGNNDPSSNFLEEHNYSLFGPTYNSVSSLYWFNTEWYIKNEEGINISDGVKFHITRAGINETAFSHGATSNNIDGYRTFINHPDLNGNPDAIFLYSHSNSAGVGNDNITGLEYINGMWTIYNQDLSSPIPPQSEYFILIPGNAQLTFVHTTNIFTTSSSYSIIDHPALNGNPNAKLFVSHNLTESNSVFNKNIGVYYQQFLERWTIISVDGSTMPSGQAFNVMIPDGDLDDVPDYADRCTGYDDAIDRDQDGDPDYCDQYNTLSEYCDATKIMYEDHLPGEILSYVAKNSITSDRKINTTAQISFYSNSHILNQDFEIVQGATFEAYVGIDCDSDGS